MSFPTPAPTLKSESIGNILIAFLWTGLGVSVLSLLFSLSEFLAPDFYTQLAILDAVNVLIQALITVITIILFLVWMYQLHADLKVLFNPYPVSSGEAMAQLIIPFYNLWGIWNVFATLADRLKSKGGQLAGAGSALRFWLPLLYVAGIASRILNRIVLNQSLMDAEQGASTTLILVTVGVDLFLSIIWLQMARIIVEAVKRGAGSREMGMAVGAEW
ncbi:MAG TPA: DUF4328 domain-containing protein [Blastocatellia bacterium]|nr:DUF4328 domain-containing protein [Blastocatellia bacterium]